MLLLLAGLGCFGMYLATGQKRYRELGIRIVKWAVLAGLAFFAVLIVERLVTMA
ncbi:MAG: hypothetical protein ABIQ60_04325 [Burkholderiaceae bacterium]